MPGVSQTVDSRPDGWFSSRVFYAVASLAVVSIALSLGGRYFGHSLSLGGHTDDQRLNEIVIGDNVLSLPSNMIRFRNQRRDGISERVDIYLHWPDMQGYSESAKDDFNAVNDTKRIVFLSIEEQSMSRDMSGRYLPIYSGFIAEPGVPGPSGLTIHKFRQDSGFAGEELIVANRAGEKLPFVARCLDEAASQSVGSACQRDIHFGNRLQLMMRFPREMMGEWEALDTAMRTFAETHLKADAGHPAE